MQYTRCKAYCREHLCGLTVQDHHHILYMPTPTPISSSWPPLFYPNHK